MSNTPTISEPTAISQPPTNLDPQLNIQPVVAPLHGLRDMVKKLSTKMCNDRQNLLDPVKMYQYTKVASPGLWEIFADITTKKKAESEKGICCIATIIRMMVR